MAIEGLQLGVKERMGIKTKNIKKEGRAQA